MDQQRRKVFRISIFVGETVNRNTENMCRNIKPLYNFEPAATDHEIRAAAAQFVHKVSGFGKSSAINAAALETAVEEITCASKKLLDLLVTTALPKDRAVENAKAKERSRLRFGAAKTD